MITINGSVAVIGASGFVGTRTVEILAGQGVPVVPVVRSVASMARLSRFDLDTRIANATDVAALAHALRDCETLVHAVVGDPNVIIKAAEALIPAARKAGVRRVVYLSTASVHGLVPAKGSCEDSPLSDKQPFAYNNAKVRAEARLRRAWLKGGVELVMLRPSVVFGPRDRWVSTVAAELQAQTAWLVGGGQGICNSIYVDNLVHAITQALAAPVKIVDGRAYLVGDAEQITWADFYRTTAEAMSVPFDTVHQIPTPFFPTPGFAQRAGALRASPAVQALLPWVPATLKRTAKAVMGAWGSPAVGNPWCMPAVRSMPTPNAEWVALQSCDYRLPGIRAQNELGYRPPVTFIEGMRRTVAWLDWCGLSGL